MASAAIELRDVTPGDEAVIHAIAELLLEAFARSHWPHSLEHALSEVRESLGPGRISRAALEDGAVVGWVGGIAEYHGNAYELHALAVKPGHQRRGIGTALVRDLEEQARRRGAQTVYLGTDDEFGGTTLFGADVYPNVLEHLAAIRNIHQHPYEFYQKLGYAIVGMIPDANGFGKPDIIMAKRLTPQEA